MKVHEYQARDLLASVGIPVPNGKMVQTVEEAESAAGRIYEQSVGSPVLQARALSVRTQAQGYIDGYRLSNMQDELDSYVLDLLGPGVVPDAVAEAADSEAGLVFERNADRPALQARAAFVRAQALGVLDDWRNAVTWAERAVNLAPGNQEYQRNLQDQRQSPETAPGGTP